MVGITANPRKTTTYDFFHNHHHSAVSISPVMTTEADLVKAILQALQGLSSSLFCWDYPRRSFSPVASIHLSHLSPSTLHSIFNPFLLAATRLQLVRTSLLQLDALSHDSRVPLTLRAFSFSVSSWLHKLQTIALKQEEKIAMADHHFSSTLLALSSSLSSLCTSARNLFDIVIHAIPPSFFTQPSPPNSFISAHVIDHIYLKLNEVCLIHGHRDGDDAYHMILFLFIGTLLPYTQMLDSWLFEGTLDDPFEELFFSANTSVLVDHPQFWDRGYNLRGSSSMGPCFLNGVARYIVSAGKSLQLLRYSDDGHSWRSGTSSVKDGAMEEEMTPGLTFSETFLVSIAALIGDGDRLFRFLNPFDSEMSPPSSGGEKTWQKLLNSAVSRNKNEGGRQLWSSFSPVNPTVAVCRGVLREKTTRGKKNLWFNFNLLPQDDEDILEELLPFPTVLPVLQDDFKITDIMPFQKNSTLSSAILTWIKDTVPRRTPLPLVLTEECLMVYIKREVESIGRDILKKLMKEWRLIENLGNLRAIYLLGSGDLLHHFFTFVFRKLDKGESWEDDFELNTKLQESIRNSSDGKMIIASPDSLVVSKSKKTKEGGLLECLKFSYKVPWPLEIIVTEKVMDKYGVVMGFLLKIKRAKYVLDKCRRLIWKGKGKKGWLVEQKLIHFVDVFHEYVMERVYHSAWREMCEGVVGAGSLDEVVEVHEAYLLSIQRQCFVASDKLGALIATRVNCILKLALDFHSALRSVSSCSAAAMKAEAEVGRVEKQFDDCVGFLLRVLSLKLNVGNLPHLANLVTRINYNYYYMTDAGTVIVDPDTSNSATMNPRNPSHNQA